MTSVPIGEIYLKCPNCGATDQFAIPDNATEDSEIVCHACGETVCTVGEFNAEAIRKGKAALPDIAAELRKRLNLK
jgi:hypothetical protein